MKSFIKYLDNVDEEMERLAGVASTQEMMDEIAAAQESGWDEEECAKNLIEQYKLQNS